MAFNGAARAVPRWTGGPTTRPRRAVGATGPAPGVAMRAARGPPNAQLQPARLGVGGQVVEQPQLAGGGVHHALDSALPHLAAATAHRAHPCAPGHLTGAAVNSTVPTFLCFEMLVASSSRQDPGWFSQNWKTGAVSVSSSQWFG